MDTPNGTVSPTIVAVAMLANTATTTNASSSSSSNTNQSPTAANKYSYSAPASPIGGNSGVVSSSTTTSNTTPSRVNPTTTHNPTNTSNTYIRNPTIASPPPPMVLTPHNRANLYAAYAAAQQQHTAHNSALSTPKKSINDVARQEAIRNQQLRTPNGNCELQSLRLEHPVQPVHVINSRYVISICESQLNIGLSAGGGGGVPVLKTPPSIFRQRIDILSSNMKCTDIYTKQEFLCKIINEPLHKVQRAYFALKQDMEGCQSTIYGHTLIRGVHEIVPLSEKRTYIIIAPKPQPPPSAWSTPVAHEQYNQGADNWGVYEDLHTYIRNKRRLCETEARALFHQICQTVQVCHRNGIILRDLKLKRFYFIDEARTKLQYESLEGSMILDDLSNDTLSDKIGCPLYTAPELLCPNPTYHGKPADMWSLGVILYTMLVGQYPFYERGNYNLITVIRHCHVQIPSSLSRSVRWLLLALLRKNYEERMTSSQIFISPWLKEQRPFYMYVPVDVVVSDSSDDEDEEMTDAGAEAVRMRDEEEVLYNWGNASNATVAADAAAAGAQTHDDIGVQPLDYSCATLTTVQSNSNAAHPSSGNSGEAATSGTGSSSSSNSRTLAQDIEMSSA